MSRRMLILLRAICAVLGAGLSATGAFFLLTTEPPAALLGLAVWLVAAVVLHDGVFAPVVQFVNRAVGGATRGFSSSVATTIRILFGVGALLTLIVVPELIAQARPHANPTILVGDYAMRLLVVWGVITVAAASIVTSSVVRTRRRYVRRRSTRE